MKPLLDCLLVSFEGIDGAGKTTLIDATIDCICKRGDRSLNGYPILPLVIPAPSWRDDLAKKEAILAAPTDEQITHHVDDFHTIQKRLASLPRSSVVFQDRWVDSMLAYQGPDDLSEMSAFAEKYAKDLVSPHLTIYVTCSVDDAVERLQAKGETPDRAILESAQRKYEHLYSAEILAPDWHWQATPQRLQTIYRMTQAQERRIIKMPTDIKLSVKAEITAQAVVHALWSEFGEI